MRVAAKRRMKKKQALTRVAAIQSDEKDVPMITSIVLWVVEQRDDNSHTISVNKRPVHLVILSLLRLVESSTTTGTPDLLIVVLLLLEHLSALSLVLLDSELQSLETRNRLHTLARRYLASNFLTSSIES